jgi:dienelactone hydrolase
MPAHPADTTRGGRVGATGGWQARFLAPHPVAYRPARGPADLALVVEQRVSGIGGFVWDGRTGDRTPIAAAEVAWGATLTPDGRAIIQLDDPDGTEVGHLHAIPVHGGRSRDLTPGFGWYVVRGVDVAPDGRRAVATLVDGSGFALWELDLAGDAAPRRLFLSPNEAWYGIVSQDGALAAIDTTDHNPGIRRFAVTVIETATGRVVATLTDGPLGPVHRVRFSGRAGDPRLLVETERTGFVRPCVWDPVSGARVDVELPDRTGDVLALDWDVARDRLLLLHVEGGVHRLLEHHLDTGETVALDLPPGSYAEPDVGDVHPMVFGSHYAPDGALRLVRSRWNEPLHVVERGPVDGVLRPRIEPAPVPAGAPFTSTMVVSRDGMPVQLWVATPPGARPVRGTVLSFHGGPNLVVVDKYDPSAQAWLDEGFAYASLNFRGSVTFGRAFREGFWGSLGDHEIEDVEAALAWLRDRGLADPATTFATGGSYGGLVTLLCLGRLPDSFAGGLAHVALADWALAYAGMNPALQAAWRGFLGGTPETAPERFRRASPIGWVSQVRAPVWLSQGRNDTRTPPGQAQAYADALRAAGGDVLLEWFEGGHAVPGLDRSLADQGRMLELVDRRLRGLRWDEVEAPG